MTTLQQAKALADKIHTLTQSQKSVTKKKLNELCIAVNNFIQEGTEEVFLTVIPSVIELCEYSPFACYRFYDDLWTHNRIQIYRDTLEENSPHYQQVDEAYALITSAEEEPEELHR